MTELNRSEMTPINQLMNIWLSGFSSSIWESRTPLNVLYNAQKKAMITYLKKYDLEFPYVNTKPNDFLQWFILTMVDAKFIAKDNFILDLDGNTLHINIQAPCIYRDACKSNKDNNVPLICYHGLTFQVILELGLGRRFKQGIFEFSPEKQCKILMEGIPEAQVHCCKSSKVSLAIIKMSDFGPDPILRTNLPEDLQIGDDKLKISEYLMKVGILYSTTIGGGADYPVGLFGPFPVPDSTKLYCMPYSFMLEDKSLQDARYKGIGYFILLIFFNRKKEKLFDRDRLENIMIAALKGTKSVEQLNEEFIDYLAKEIDKFIAKDIP